MFFTDYFIISLFLLLGQKAKRQLYFTVGSSISTVFSFFEYFFPVPALSEFGVMIFGDCSGSASLSTRSLPFVSSLSNQSFDFAWPHS